MLNRAIVTAAAVVVASVAIAAPPAPSSVEEMKARALERADAEARAKPALDKGVAKQKKLKTLDPKVAPADIPVQR
jgi:hypothetical protein